MQPSFNTDAWQDAMLAGVSRTFALTIPQLPGLLRKAVSNAYLVCRTLDTIEDEPALSLADKAFYSNAFLDCLSGRGAVEQFSNGLAPKLTGSTLEAERVLIREVEHLIAIYRGFPESYSRPIFRCAQIMTEGMLKHQEPRAYPGLENLIELNRYCYYVAGVVGEMLTELYAAYTPKLANPGALFMQQAVSFGQGLQMTNILKDICDDRARGACWLPRDILAKHGCTLDAHAQPSDQAAFESALGELIGVAHGHLAQALDYTLKIPAEETGIRNFCLWALAMAALSLRKLNANRHFTESRQVKITRRTVKWTVVACKLNVRNDWALRLLFKAVTRNLPYSEIELPVPR